MYGKPADIVTLGGGGTGALAATGASPLALLGLVVAVLTLIAAGVALRSLAHAARDKEERPGKETRRHGGTRWSGQH